MSENEQETKLLSALAELLKEYGDYGEAKLRADGDITIPLDPELKRKRARGNQFANAFSEMMRSDIGPKRSSTWIK